MMRVCPALEKADTQKLWVNAVANAGARFDKAVMCTEPFEALARTEVFSPGVAILDIGLPVLDGKGVRWF